MNFTKFRDSLLRCCESGDYEGFVRLAEAYPEIFSRWSELCHKPSNDSLAHVAAKCGSEEILRYLHENCGTDAILKGQNTDKKTPLHMAAQYGNVKCLKYLLTSGVPVDPLKRADWTPLMLACTKNNIDVIKALMEANADLWLRNKDGWTAFHIACREGHPDIINLLLDCDPIAWKTKSNNGRTPLHTAALNGCFDSVKILLERGHYPPDEADACGTTPFMDAASSNDVHIMKLLSASKASPFACDALGRSAVHLAAQAGSLDSLHHLIVDCGVDVNAKTNNAETPLHFAAKENQIEAVKFLCSFGADASLCDLKGRTAKDAALCSEHFLCAKLLEER